MMVIIPARAQLVCQLLSILQLVFSIPMPTWLAHWEIWGALPAYVFSFPSTDTCLCGNIFILSCG